MKRKALVWLTTFVVAITMIFGGSAAVFADTTTGELAWAYKPATTDWYGVTSPALSGSYVYFVSYDTLYKVDKSTGKVAGQTKLDGNAGWSKHAPTIGGGKAYVPLNGSKVAIVDISSMELIKVVTYAEGQSNHQSVTPITYDSEQNCIYAASWIGGSPGTYAKIDLDDYKVTKIVDADKGFYWAGACADGDYVVFGSNANGEGDTPADGTATLYAYKKADGTIKSVDLSDSGSVCSTVVKSGDKYYFSTKGKKLYEAAIGDDGNITVSVKATLNGVSTCTPVISEGKAYIGSWAGKAGKVDVVDLASGDVDSSYDTPADAKTLALSGGNVYATYNLSPGGIYNVKEGSDYFTPQGNMKNYGVSSIAVDSDGTLYYTNDSNYLMAVKAKTNTTKHKVTITSGDGGTTNPSVINVADGGSATFAIESDDGYKVSSINVDGKKMTLKNNKYTSYTVEDVTKDTTVEVNFEKVSAVAEDIEVSIQKESTFHIAHKVLSVKSTLAEEYGYDDQVVADKVSALDALVAAHIYKYNTEDKATINSKLTMNDAGSPTKMVDLGSGSEYTGFAINEDYPLSAPGTGALVNNAEVKKGDRVDFFWYEDDYWCDYVTNFTDGTNKVFNIDAKAGKDFTVSVEGFMYMSGYTDHPSKPVEGAVICLVDENGNATPILDKSQDPFMTDEHGDAVVNIDKVGKYHLAALQGDYDYRIVMPWCTVNVECDNHNFENGKCTKCDKEIEYRVVLGDVKPIGNLSAQQIVEQMKSGIININKNIPKSQINVTDVNLQFSPDNGKTWQDSTAKDWPENGVDILYPYPKGTNGASCDFTMIHMFDNEIKDYKVGDIEHLTPVETNDGIKLHVISASPYAIGWEITNPDAIKTGDDSNIMLFAVIAALALAAAATVVIVKRKKA